jgi:transposase
VAEIGDVRRFATPWQLMAYLGLVPSERSTGEQVRRGSITKAGTQEPAVCSSRAPGLIAIQLT